MPTKAINEEYGTQRELASSNQLIETDEIVMSRGQSLSDVSHSVGKTTSPSKIEQLKTYTD